MIRTILLAFLTIFQFAVAQPAPAQEITYERDLEAQAEQFVAAYIQANPQADATMLQRAKNIALLKFKQMGAMQDILKTVGTAPAKAIVMTEILDTFILPPILTAIGEPVLAGISAVVPWGLLIGGSVAWYQVSRERWKMARELNTSSLRPLDTLRRELMGYDLKHRVTSLIFDELSEKLPGLTSLEVVRRYTSETGPVVSLAELESIVRAQGKSGERFLDAVYLDKAKPDLYAAKLVRYIMAEADSSSRLIALLSPRVQTVPSTTRTSLVELHRRMQEIEALKAAELEKTAAAKQRRKKRELSRQEFKELKAAANQQIVALNGMKFEVRKAEYSLLLTHKNLAAERARAKAAASGGSCRAAVASGF
ncbi:MAG TPA: hypothetical protein VFV50_17155 [Bdellovibrionales bacterium]|nr:hypothetical protein [Bdellovibrionales bacterium]